MRHVFAKKNPRGTGRDPPGQRRKRNRVRSVLEMRLAVQELRVEHGQDAGEGFPERQPDPGRLHARVFRRESERVDAVPVRQIHRALAVELLRDDREFGRAVEIAGAHDRIERAESGVVHQDVLRRDARLDEFAFHVARLVVLRAAVVAGHDDPPDFSRAVKRRGRPHALAEIVVQVFPFDQTRRPEQQAVFARRDVLDGRVHASRRAAFHAQIGADDGERGACGGDHERTQDGQNQFLPAQAPFSACFLIFFAVHDGEGGEEKGRKRFFRRPRPEAAPPL